MGEVATLREAIAKVADGSVLAVGGPTLSRKPIAAVRELVRRGARGLELVTFTGSVEVEALLAAGALAAVRSSPVG
ncbi:MAG: CoA transferase, partial [Solirubrobacteraceae bacterium]